MKELKPTLGPKRAEDDHKRLSPLLLLLVFICQWFNDQLISALLLVGGTSGPSLPKGVVFFFWVRRCAGFSFVPFKCKVPILLNGVLASVRPWREESGPLGLLYPCPSAMPLPLPRRLDSSRPKVAKKALEQAVMGQQ